MNLDLSSLPENLSITKEQALLLLRNQEEKYQSQIDYLEEQNRLLRCAARLIMTQIATKMG